MSAESATRQVLLVGSLPYADEASAMARACELAGDRLIALPDGEIGERSDQYPAGDRSQWTAGLAGRLADEASLFAVVEAGKTNEQGLPRRLGLDGPPAPPGRPRRTRRPAASRLRHVRAPVVAPCRAPAGVARPARSPHAGRLADRFRRRRRLLEPAAGVALRAGVRGLRVTRSHRRGAVPSAPATSCSRSRL